MTFITRLDRVLYEADNRRDFMKKAAGVAAGASMPGKMIKNATDFATGNLNLQDYIDAYEKSGMSLDDLTAFISKGYDLQDLEEHTGLSIKELKKLLLVVLLK